MDIVNVAIAAIQFPNILSILIVAVGLGMVIFFHELGHFLVAKWCGVYVERFSIGFGAPIFGFKWGETDYSFGWLPFGGYVKMLGQDDMDPSQLTDDQVSANPRSYTSKSVLQRMAIISAGVIMNVITGVLFFVLVFHWGIEKVDNVIGYVQPNSPAWRHGIRSGDTITSINGVKVQNFDDIMRRTTLSRGEMDVHGVHADGGTFEYRLRPDKREIARAMGVTPQLGLELVGENYKSFDSAVVPGTAAYNAGFKKGDRIVAVAGQPVDNQLAYQKVLSENASHDVEFTVSRTEGKETSEVKVTVPPQAFLELGFRVSMGKIQAIQNDSVAGKAGIQVEDRIAKVDGKDVGRDVDPLRLSEYFSDRAGQTVVVTITRTAQGGPQETLEVNVVPEAHRAWTEVPFQEQTPFSIPSLGIAYQVVPKVLSVVEGSAAAAAQIQPNDTIMQVNLHLKKGVAKDGLGDKTLEVETMEAANFPYVFWKLQADARDRIVKLKLKSESGTEREVELTPQLSEDWFMPTERGLIFTPREKIVKADTWGEAVSMGVRYGVTSIEDIYLTLRGLFTRDISPKGLSGPIGIAQLAYTFATFGLTSFVLFLGMISINLAVINFLPIPVLDGGHMVFLLWEGIFRRKPSEAVVATATYFGLFLLLMLFMFVIFQDISKLIGR